MLMLTSGVCKWSALEWAEFWGWANALALEFRRNARRNSGDDWLIELLLFAEAGDKEVAEDDEETADGDGGAQMEETAATAEAVNRLAVLLSTMFREEGRGESNDAAAAETKGCLMLATVAGIAELSSFKSKSEPLVAPTTPNESGKSLYSSQFLILVWSLTTVGT